jgi:predicted phage-related endonuclease
MTDVRPQEWYDERRTYIGASQAADALGLSPWGDPIGVWEEKVGEAAPRNESFRMRMGSLIEPIIGKLAAEHLTEISGLQPPHAVRLHRVTGPVRHPDHPFIASNPDFRIVGLPGVRGLVQAKYKLDGIPWGEPDDAGLGLGIPLHYRIQGWGELLTTGADVVFFAVLDPRTGLGLWPLDRRAGENEQAIEDLRADLVEFWTEYVEKKIPPPPSAKSTDALARRFPRAAAKVGKVASAEQEEKLRELLDAVVAKDEAAEHWELLKNEVRAMIGTADYIEGAGKRFHWSNVGLGEDGEPKTKTVVEWEPIAKAYRAMLDGAVVDSKQNGSSVSWDGESYVVKMKPHALEAIESLYTREEVAEPSRRFTIGEIK